MKKPIIEHWKSEMEKDTVKITQSKIEAVKKTFIHAVSVRVYDGSSIGVAGTYAPFDEHEITQKAMDVLKLKIDYPCAPTSQETVTRSYPSIIPNKEIWINEAEDLLAHLERDMTTFQFQGAFHHCIETTQIANEMGLDLKSQIDFCDLLLTFKSRSSTDLVDGYIVVKTPEWNPKKIHELLKKICAAWEHEIPLPVGKQPIIFLSTEPWLLSLMVRELNADKMGTGSSLFSEKKHHRIFNNRFSLYATRNPEDHAMIPFFDSEGVSLPDDQIPLIFEGHILSPFSDKRSAHRYGYPLTATAGGSFNEIPHIEKPELRIKPTSKCMEELLNSHTGILVLVSAGGGYAPDGAFAIPVSTAFLFDGQEIVGRLPPFNLRSNIWKIFGEDYLGTLEGYLFKPWGYRPTVIQMELFPG